MTPPRPRPDRLLRTAVGCALAGTACLLAFLVRGFSAWSVGLGLFLGAPLLAAGMLLYVIGVVRDLKRRRVL